MFITFEGGEGSGKTTAAHKAAIVLRDRGYDVLLTHEPGGTLLGESLRTLLLDARSQAPVSSKSELLMFCAARAQLVSQVLKPHLAKQNGVVLCDRYADSTLAYQGYGRGLQLETLKTILEFATDGLKPELTLYLDVKPEIGLQRRQKPGQEWNRLDALSLEFHQKVYHGYLALIEQEPQRWRRVDASRSIDEVSQNVIDILAHLLPPKKEQVTVPSGRFSIRSSVQSSKANTLGLNRNGKLVPHAVKLAPRSSAKNRTRKT